MATKPLSIKKVNALADQFGIDRMYFETLVLSHGAILYKRHLRNVVDALISSGHIDIDALFALVVKRQVKPNGKYKNS